MPACTNLKMRNDMMKRALVFILCITCVLSAFGTAYGEGGSETDAVIISGQELVKSGAAINAFWKETEFEGNACAVAWGGKTRETTGAPVLQYVFKDGIDISQYRFMVIDYYRTGSFKGMNIKLRTLINGGSNLNVSLMNENNKWHKTLYELRGENSVSEKLLWFQYKPFGESATLENTQNEKFYIKSIGFYKENPFTDEEKAEYEIKKKEYDEAQKEFMGEKQEHADFSYLDGYEKTPQLLSDPSFENFEDITADGEISDNLIKGSSFEGAVAKEFHCPAGGDFETVSDKQTGGKCVKMFNRKNTYSSFACNVKEILENYGQGIYKASVKIKAGEGAKSVGNNYYLSAKVKGSLDTSASWQGNYTKIAAGWQTHEATFTIMWNGDVSSAIIYVEGSKDTEDFYVDDFELYKVSDITQDANDTLWRATSNTAKVTKTDGAYDGDYCIKIENRLDASTGIVQNITNALNENGCGFYSVSAYIKTDKNSLSVDKPYIIYLRLSSDGGTTTEKRVDYYISDDWQRIYFVFDLQWKGKVTSALFMVRGYENSDNAPFYIDNAEMFKYIQNDYTEQHNSYMTGYPDNTFRPDAFITRAEALEAVAKTVAGKTVIEGLDAGYKDVSDGDWYKNSAALLKRIGATNGIFDKDYLYPDKEITRAEMAALLSKTGTAKKTENASFSDVSDDYFLADGIKAAAQMGIVNGYYDNTFRPDAFITRAEAAAMINRSVKRHTTLGSFYGKIINKFSDVDEDNWAYCDITEATNDHKATVFDKGGEKVAESWKIDEKTYDRELAKSVADSIETKGEALKEEILNAKDNMSVSGTKYYVSNSGDDNNSGTSPENAWKSTDKVSNFDFNEGDGVFFERGSVWYGVCMQLKSGVTYAAYGEGEKPELYGTAKNYADPNLWKKTEIENVWETTDEISGPAGFVLFDNEICSYKANSNAELKKNFDFFDTDYNTSPIRIYYEGKNPGEAFETIYIAPGTSVMNAAGKKDIYVDNLAVKYTGWHGFQTSEIHNMHITNCVVGWIGGAGGASRWGNGIEFWANASDCSVDHCWVYQVYDTGLTNQFTGVCDDICVEQNIRYTNNLVDYCTYSFEFFMNQSNSNKDLLKDIYIENNISRYAGYGWGNDNRPNKDVQCQVKGWVSKNRADNIVIRNNMFGKSRYGTLHYGARPINKNFSAYLVVLPQYGINVDNNVYIEKVGAPFSEYKGIKYTYGYDLHTEFIKNNVDKNAKIILLDEE